MVEILLYIMIYIGNYFLKKIKNFIIVIIRYNIDKNEWKKISSPNSPPPRCSHQAVSYK